MTIEWKTTVARPSAGSASRSASQSPAAARSTEAGTDAATSSAADSSFMRQRWSGQTYESSVTRPSAEVGSIGRGSQPRRSITVVATSMGGGGKASRTGEAAAPHACPSVS
jgi:hypothetical protein